MWKTNKQLIHILNKVICYTLLMNKCKFCGRLNKNKFCDEQCRDDYFTSIKKTKIKKPRKPHKKHNIKIYLSDNKCLVCGGDIFYKFKSNEQKFCSSKCKYQSNYLDNLEVFVPKKKICPVCGDEFYTRTRQERFYCNFRCASKAYFIKKKELSTGIKN